VEALTREASGSVTCPYRRAGDRGIEELYEATQGVSELETASAGPECLGGHPEQQQSGYRAVRIAVALPSLNVDARLYGERHVAVTARPERPAIARITVRETRQDELLGGEGGIAHRSALVENFCTRLDDFFWAAVTGLGGLGVTPWIW
jgi:hypothetical protein